MILTSKLDERGFKTLFDQGDLVILISSSGSSQNILNEVWCKQNDINLITFSGMKK